MRILSLLAAVAAMLLAGLLTGCGGNNAAGIVSPPVLIVESSANGTTGWTNSPVVDGRASVPAGYWQRVYPDSGVTTESGYDRIDVSTSARLRDISDVPTPTAKLRGLWRWHFVATKGEQTFKLSVLVDGN